MPEHIERALAPYFEEGERGLWTQLVEDQTDALLVAVLIELQALNAEDSPSRQTPDIPAPRSGENEAEYYAGEIEITSDEQSVDLGFKAEDVLIYGASEPIEIAFKDPAKSNRAIPLGTSDLPYNVAPETGLGAEEIWYRLGDSASGSTTAQLVVF
ncbi:hypothetical protein [Halapricum hydrolyticum]|uniref:Uncharacterized protein n=1 Tax=Halapricum hydrolyticum TaxID=2979991 RepID=A0AAE3I8B6_9EURY|nr:hypothetical protein [Halapricum hydrolyticum]MCU4716862.1 hypothetical protein [Halapricum hydrolyticum]MCU4725533.1 hypothetical protein [Halapricum hydrolyticum]